MEPLLHFFKKYFPRSSKRGSIIVENALLFPLLVTVLLGSYEMGRYILLQQKLIRSSATIADLVSRSATLTTAEIDDIFNATRSVMVPFNTGANSVMIISSVTRTGNNAPRVTWQRRGAGSLGTPSTIGVQGGNATLPPGFVLPPGDSLIAAEIVYNYSPTFFAQVFHARTIHHYSYMHPRLSPQVVLN